jgi:DNA-binding response OmpR family regulator
MTVLPILPTITEGVPPRVLIVEPDRNYLSVLARRIGDAGYRIASAPGAQAALAEMHRMAPDVLLAELSMGRTSGVELIRLVRGDQVHHDVPLIMIGGRSEAGAAVRALRAGADDVVRKPFDFDVLIARIARQIARARSLSELRHANAALDARVVTRSLALGELADRLQASEAECRRLESMVRKSA